MFVSQQYMLSFDLFSRIAHSLLDGPGHSSEASFDAIQGFDVQGFGMPSALADIDGIQGKEGSRVEARHVGRDGSCTQVVCCARELGVKTKT